MSRSTQKWLRFIVPGLLLLVFNGLFGKVSGLWEPFWPESVNDAMESLTVFVLAGLYYLLPFRRWMNARFYSEVNENLRSRMIAIGGLSDDSNVFTWKAIRGIFWHFVDNDKSLSAKSEAAYFNGLIWTTIADIRVVATAYFGGAFVIGILGEQRAWLAAITFLGIWVASWIASVLVTKRHKHIGNQQLEIIEHKHVAELASMLGGVRDRSNREGS